MPNVLDAFVADDIVVHMRPGGSLDRKVLDERLTKLAITLEEISKEAKRLLR